MRIEYSGAILDNDTIEKIIKIGKHYDIDPRFMIVQLYHETHWGQHPNSKSGRVDNNWGGMTMTSDSEVITRPSGVVVTRGLARPSNEGGYYMHYDNVGDFLKDWAYLLRNGGSYKVSGMKDLESYVKGLFRYGGARYDYAGDGSDSEEAYSNYLKAMKGAYIALNNASNGLLDKLSSEGSVEISKEDDMVGKAEKAIQWFESKLGKVTYSMENRNGEYSYDCSSAVYSAFIHAGILPKGTWLGNTETLYALEGKLLQPIPRSEIRRGDMFVSGVKGNSLGSGGHTGMVYSPNQIIHCNYRDNGITITGIDGRSGTPLHFYRIKDGGVSAEKTSKHAICTIDSLRVHSSPVGTSKIVDTLHKGDIKNIDSLIKTDKYTWASYVSYQGDRRYFPIEDVTDNRAFAELKDGFVDLKNKITEEKKESVATNDIQDKSQDDYDLIINGEKYRLTKG